MCESSAMSIDKYPPSFHEFPAILKDFDALQNREFWRENRVKLVGFFSAKGAKIKAGATAGAAPFVTAGGASKCQRTDASMRNLLPLFILKTAVRLSTAIFPDFTASFQRFAPTTICAPHKRNLFE